MRNVDVRVLREFPLSEKTRLEISLELFNALGLDNVEYGGFNRIYGPGLDLSTGVPVGPSPSFGRLRSSDGNYDRNNTQVLGTGPFPDPAGELASTSESAHPAGSG